MTDPLSDSRIFETLASLNQIGAAMNQLAPGDALSVANTLTLIVEGATRVVPGASAVIYTFNQTRGDFDHASRVASAAGDQAAGDEPRPNGLGMRSIRQRRRVLSSEEIDLEIHPVRAQAGAHAMGCFPLFVAEEPVGALYVYLPEARAFSQLELLMLENFVNLAAMAIYHAHNLEKMQRDLARKDEELLRLRRAGLLISSRSRLEETLKSILEMALEVTDAEYGIFRLLDRSGQFLNTGALAGAHLAHPQVEVLPVEANSVMSTVARTRQPICIADLEAEPWAQIYYPLDSVLRMRSELAVPLIGATGRLEGVLNLESPAVNAFSETDSHLLQAFATQAVIAIQEVRLLDALQEITRLLLTQPETTVLKRLAELACDLLGASASVIWRLESETLILESSSGGYQHGRRVPLEASLAGQAILARAAVTTDDVRSDPRFHRADLAQSQEWSRALVVPLLSGDSRQPLGAFSVYSASTTAGHFAESEWDKKVLVILADYAVLAFQNASRQEALLAAQEQRAIAETFAAVGDIASNLLHQLNNKVGTIPVRIQGIEDKCYEALASSPYLVRNLSEIERCATDAMESVRDSLSHLRPIRLEPVRLAPRVQEALQNIPLPPGIRLRQEALEDLPLVLAGGATLTWVFTNLLENAVEALNGAGEIQIRGAADSGWVEITVSDTGPGIPASLHDHIFELNFSGRGSSKPGKLGFGLWWVKTLMTRLGGTVSVESDGQRGTTFCLRLPQATAQGQD